MSIERRIKIAERALATGKPEGEESAAERGKRFSLGFSAVVRDQRALETIPRLDPKQSMRKATVHLDDLGGTSWSDRAHEFFRSLTFIIAHDSKYLHGSTERQRVQRRRSFIEAAWASSIDSWTTT